MTLRVRFAIWTAALVLLVLLAFGVFVYLQTKQGLEAGVDDLLQSSASEVIASLDSAGSQAGAEPDSEWSEVGAVSRRSRVTLWLFDQDGQVTYSRGQYGNLPTEAASLAAANAGQPTFATLDDPETGVPVRVYTVPAGGHAEQVAVVQVARSLERTREALGQLLTALLLGGPLLALGAAVGGYFLAAGALAPIGRITRTARRIAAGDLSVRIGLPASSDELGSLATTFDEMLAKLEAARRRERRFVADSSHQLRTPLAAMQAILSVTRERRRSPEAYEEALSDLSEEADRMRRLLDDLLAAARGETRAEGAHEPVDLSTLLRDVTDSMRPLAETKGLVLSCDVPDGLCLQGDRDSLIHLFVNLLDNAVKYTNEGGITLSASREDGRLRVKVTDSGIGIPPEHAPHVFDRFYRAERALSEPGAGLGLAIAAEIAHAHGAQVEVDSAPGAGSTFTVEFGTS